MGVNRLRGIDITRGDPNSLAPSIVFSLPILVLIYTTRREFAAWWPPMWQKSLSLGLAIYLTLATTSIFLTRSRTGVVCLVAFLLLLTIRRGALFKKFQKAAIVVVLCGIVFLFLPNDIQTRYRSMWDQGVGTANTHESAEGRWYGFLAGVAMFQQHPITGVGIGNFVPYRIAHVDGVALQAHNLAGEILGETGIVGASAFAALILALFLNCRRIQHLTSDSADPVLRMLSCFGFACRDIGILLLLQGLFGHNLYRYNWLWVAAFAALAVEFAAAERQRILDGTPVTEFEADDIDPMLSEWEHATRKLAPIHRT